MAWHREMMGWKNLVTKIFVKEKRDGWGWINKNRAAVSHEIKRDKRRNGRELFFFFFFEVPVYTGNLHLVVFMKKVQNKTRNFTFCLILKSLTV
jgi:hypothetical protein